MQCIGSGTTTLRPHCLCQPTSGDMKGGDMWLTRDKFRHNDREIGDCDYEIWDKKPTFSGGFWIDKNDSDNTPNKFLHENFPKPPIDTFCSKIFHRCTDIRLKPGEIMKIKKFTVVK